MTIADLWIGGERLAGQRLAEVIDPATGQPFARAPIATVEETDFAVTSAAAAFPAWSAMTWDARADALSGWIDSIETNTEALAALLMREQGKPLARAKGEIAGAIGFGRAICNLRLEPTVHRRTATDEIVEIQRPLGVTACITAWNFPLALALWKCVPALLSGNTVVLKPSPYTPLSTLRLGELGASILPPGVLNVISGDGTTGERLCSHPDVAKVSFTGSGPTGQRIMASAASTLKRLTLELGGNDAAIVRADADIHTAAQALFWGKFHNSGQLCAAAKRIFVDDRIFEAFAKAFVAAAAAAQVGIGDDPASQLGPIQNLAQWDRICTILDDAVSRGGKVLFKGDAPKTGYFHPVVVLVDVPDDALLVREEAFGPIVALLRSRNDDDAVLRANASPYGLGGSVWSTDLEAATALAARLDVGTSWVNQHPALDPLVPFGGVKGSGLGVEFGLAGLAEFTRRHVISVKRLAT